MTDVDLSLIRLDSGGHNEADLTQDPEYSACLLEAVSFVADEPWSDQPACVSPVLGAFGRSLNDVLPGDARQQLVPLIPRLIGTAGDGQDEARSYMALDWLVRTYLPAWLRLTPTLTGDADALAAHPPIVDMTSATSAGVLVRDAAKHADAAWDAAGDAAWDAARAAARDAARAAAGAAAWDAAWDAARDAARAAAGAAARVAARAAARAAAGAAAGAAAWAAARDALQPTVDALQASAIDLFTRMINPAGAS